MGATEEAPAPNVSAVASAGDQFDESSGPATAASTLEAVEYGGAYGVWVLSAASDRSAGGDGTGVWERRVHV